jgi:hypothetical protein
VRKSAAAESSRNSVGDAAAARAPRGASAGAGVVQAARKVARSRIGAIRTGSSGTQADEVLRGER